MDIFDKLNRTLNPMGGRLFIDAFVTSVQGAREAQARQEAAAEKLRADRRSESGPARKPRVRPEQRIDRSGDPEDEIAAYLNRNVIEGADEEEVQDFLRERSGFVPMDDD